ncbi:8-oxo-dGTP diphosphatase [Variovorax beijingensis]|uniref:8-oxo-dGTP diphosphatase n=2 Tax=Variovorax TaxID=34072 RepID=A0AAE3Y6G4_VARPD|nr:MULTISPECIES: NUDIX domain-containing protein [Variovorax]MDP9968689.1 8-oxo-dGTP diphosphatase [Variovorax paradoxus]MDR6430191.1 8-oxo-dGTP diphosphatase [Variovorax paradoxus]MDR6456848.1 8-oxo-dGTP diphosphatase [Variovorax paradoxus]TWD73513.1 8-oxo-dGTP diphosphatase [Variovorax beijingensis]
MKPSPKKQAGLDFPRPLVTVDVVIFTVLEDALKVVLVRRPDAADDPYPGRWALPGGFIDIGKDASLLDCALRKLREKTGVAAPYLEQLGSWGDAHRDPRGWSATHAFFALMPAQALVPGKGADAAQAEWMDAAAASRKRLAFDHAGILASAVARLRSKVEYTSLPAFLLNEPFTLPQLQHTYEVVLGRAVDKSAFRKRMLDGGFMEEAGTVEGTTGRPAMGYRLRDRSQAALFPRTFSPRDMEQPDA